MYVTNVATFKPAPPSAIAAPGLNGLGCADCNGDCSQARGQLGAIGDFTSAGVGAGTLLILAAIALGIYAFAGNPAKMRRKKLALARLRYADEVKEIKSKYGRFGARG